MGWHQQQLAINEGPVMQQTTTNETLAFQQAFIKEWSQQNRNSKNTYVVNRSSAALRS